MGRLTIRLLTEKKPKCSFLISNSLVILLIALHTTSHYLPALGDAFSCSALKQWFTIMHVILLLYSVLPKGFCVFSWLQKPPYNAWPSASFPIFMALVVFPLPYFPPVVLARFADSSSAPHDSPTLFVAHYFPWTLHILIKFCTLLPHPDIRCYSPTEFCTPVDLLATMCNINSSFFRPQLQAMPLGGFCYNVVTPDHASTYASRSFRKANYIIIISPFFDSSFRCNAKYLFQVGTRIKIWKSLVLAMNFGPLGVLFGADKAY